MVVVTFLRECKLGHTAPAQAIENPRPLKTAKDRAASFVIVHTVKGSASLPVADQFMAFVNKTAEGWSEDVG